MARPVDEAALRRLLRIDRRGVPPPTAYTANARYRSSRDGFDIKLPPIPPHVFLAERDRALDPATPTGLIPLDLSRPLRLDPPATTPLILARYARIRAGDILTTTFAASAEIYYVIDGRGTTAFVGGDEAIEWAPGDVFCLPGGGAVLHRARHGDAILWVVTNEPQLAFERCRPPTAREGAITAAHYPDAAIRRELLAVHLDVQAESMAGKAVTLGNGELDARRTCTPSFTLAMNSLGPGDTQRAHRHNAVAVTLVVAGEGCYSLVDGARVDWQTHAVMITPPAALHSHHNEGNEMALFLIVQDGGLHYHCRTMGFQYD